MMLQREDISFIPDTPTAVRAYNITDYPPHWHDDCLEVIFVLKGQVQVLASYDRFQLQEGDYVVLNEGDIHYLHGNGDNLVISLYIDLLQFEDQQPYIRYLNFICESFNTNSMQEKYVPELRKLLVMVIVEAAKNDKEIDKINENMRQIMELLVYKFDMAHYYNGRDIAEDQLQRYHRIMKEIEEGYEEKVSLEALAQKEFIGKTYISQFWKKMTNMNFTEYLNSRRSEMAEKLLFTTEKSINEISLYCGFSDPKYIYKSFKKWYDRTPSAHKKAYQEYMQRGACFEEYDGTQLLGSFGRDLIDSFMDEEKSYLIHSADLSHNWKEKYEYQMRKYTGSRIKKEMIRESHQALGLREIYMPLLDKNAAGLRDGKITYDTEFVENIFRIVREMSYVLCIEIRFEERSAEEWEQIITGFASSIQHQEGKEALSRCRFCIYFSEFEKDVEVKGLIDRLKGHIDSKNIKMALKFD